MFVLTYDYFFQAAPNVTIAQTNTAQPLQTAAAQVPALAGMQQVVFLNPTQLATALQPQLMDKFTLILLFLSGST